MNATQLIHMSQYINPLKSLLTLASVDRQTRIFIATDDPAAEKEITASFSEGERKKCRAGARMYRTGCKNFHLLAISQTASMRLAGINNIPPASLHSANTGSGPPSPPFPCQSCMLQRRRE